MNVTINQLLNHKSARSYQDKPVENEKIDQIIRAVQQAPNWNNFQMVSIVTITNPEKRKKITKLCGDQEYVNLSPVFLVFCADYYRISLALGKLNQNLESVLKDIDTLIVGANEVGIAVGTAVAAAEALGLSTVPIGDARLHAKEMVVELELPKYVFPMVGLCIGYATENEDRIISPRLPKEAVCFENVYNKDLMGYIAQFDKTYADYLKTTDKKSSESDRNWSTNLACFYKEPYHYLGIAEALEQQGYPGKDREE